MRGGISNAGRRQFRANDNRSVNAVTTHFIMICRMAIRRLNSILIVSGTAMAVAAVLFSVLSISKALYGVSNRSAWYLAMLTVFGIAMVNLFLACVVFILSRATKLTDFSSIKYQHMALQKYIRIEFRVVAILMGIALLAFQFHAKGADFVTFQGDPWWVISTRMSWRISGCASVLRPIQLITWDCDLTLKT